MTRRRTPKRPRRWRRRRRPRRRPPPATPSPRSPCRDRHPDHHRRCGDRPGGRPRRDRALPFPPARRRVDAGATGAPDTPASAITSGHAGRTSSRTGPRPSRRARAGGGARGRGAGSTPFVPEPPRRRARSLQRSGGRAPFGPNRRDHVGVTGGGADPGRRRCHHDERAARRAAGQGAVQGDQRRGRPARGPGRVDPSAARIRRVALVALRRPGGPPRRLAVRGRERRRQDDDHRQAGPARVRGRALGAPRRR